MSDFFYSVFYSSSVICDFAGIQASPFAVDPADTVVAVNSTAVLTCTPPYSQPSPTVFWRKNGAELNLTNSRITVLATGNLYITSAQFIDAGEYQCIAHNEITGAKRRSTIATLTVSSGKSTILSLLIIPVLICYEHPYTH